MRPLLLICVCACACALVPSSPAAAATYRTCRGADPDNGITKVRVLRARCALGVAVAKRTNRVKCFLNGERCTHRFRGRAWTCTLRERSSSDRVTCRSARKRVRYRLG